MVFDTTWEKLSHIYNSTLQETQRIEQYLGIPKQNWIDSRDEIWSTE